MGINFLGTNSSILQGSLSLASSIISNPLGIGQPPLLAQPPNLFGSSFPTQLPADPFASFNMAFPGFSSMQQQTPLLINNGGILNGLVGGNVGQQSTFFLNGLLGGIIGGNSLGVVQGLLGDQGSFNNTLNGLLTSTLTGGGGTTLGVAQSLFSGGAGSGAVGGNADLTGALGNAFTGLNTLGVLGLSFSQVQNKIQSSGSLIPSLLNSQQGKAGLLGGTEGNIANLTKGMAPRPAAPPKPAAPGSALSLARAILGKPDVVPPAPAAPAAAPAAPAAPATPAG